MSTVTVKSSEPAPPQTPITPVSTVVQKEPAHRGSAASPQVDGNDKVLKTLIGKNSDYYLKQFDKIDRGEKSFNIWAFFFAPILLLYRRQFSYFAKLILPWYALLFVQMVLAGYAAATFNLELIAVTGFTGLIILVYAIATAIICGRGFNNHYKTQLHTAIAGNQLKVADENTLKKFKPSAFIPILFVILSLVLSFALNLLVVTVATNSLLNDYNEIATVETAPKQASVKAPTKINQPTPLTDEDLKLDGISLNSTVDELFKKYGKPDKVREYEFPGFGGGNPIFVMNSYRDGLIEVHFLKSNNEIYEIRSRASNIFTPRNIAAGLSEKDMFVLYGKKSAENENKAGNLIYSYELSKSPRVLDFEVDPNTHKIVSISINSWAD